MSSPFKKRRTPDPSRPGTVYRSKPKLTRGRAVPPSAAGPGAEVPLDPQGYGSVEHAYAQHGGGQAPASYGHLVDDPGHGDPRGPIAGYPGSGYPGSGYPGSGYPGSGYPTGPEGPGGPAGPDGPGRRPGGGSGRTGRRWRRPRLRLIILVLVVALIVYPALLGITAWKSLNRVDALAPAHAKVDTPDTPGRTFLVVGSDSRQNLTTAERKRLGTGSAGGQRTDTIMLLHVPAGGGPTVLVSIPRDSYLAIPGRQKNKINAAYAFGGPSLLVRTVEAATGLRVDEYVETGLGGFANVVDALGGVRLCPKRNMNDRDAHINLKKGCQQMDGKTALGYARARHSDPRGDLGRVERQRETLAAIANKTLSPSTLIQPWKAFPVSKAGGGALTVDQGTTPIGLARFVLAMRAVAGGKGLSLTVPIGDANLSTNAGSAVQWDRIKALELFRDLQKDDTEAVRKFAAEQKKAAG